MEGTTPDTEDTKIDRFYSKLNLSHKEWESRWISPTSHFPNNKGVLVLANTPAEIISGGLILAQKSTTARPTWVEEQG